MRTKLDPKLEAIAEGWDADKRQEASKMFAEWSEQILMSALEMRGMESRECAVKIHRPENDLLEPELLKHAGELTASERQALARLYARWMGQLWESAKFMERGEMARN